MLAVGAVTGAITGAITSPFCFVAGTLVLTAEGLVPIEAVSAGDIIWAENPEGGEQSLSSVVQTFENETEELVHVTVEGNTITSTPHHPFYSPVKGWTDALDLRAGDILVRSNGEYVIVEQVQHEILENPVKVYNFEVQDYHTYYVGCREVLVHNTCGNERRNAVRKAWKMEQERAKNGLRTSKTWTDAQRAELIETGKVKGYVGHHMKSVKGYPELAGDLNNIQFSTPVEHLKAHFGNFRNITHGRYGG